MIVPYRKYRAPSTHPLSNGYVERLPLLSVRLTCNRKDQKVWAIVDSAADMCTFGSEIAALLDIDLKKGRPLEMFGLVGGAELGWVHQIPMSKHGFDLEQIFEVNNTTMDHYQNDSSIISPTEAG
ncbi:MAG: hypothetical protein DMF60_21475, partial [Acidobacteria bacterium]